LQIAKKFAVNAFAQFLKENTAKTPMFTKDAHGSAFLYQK